jgi:argininosuccinate lyase
MSGVVRTLHVNAGPMADALTGGFTQATDLAEHIVTACGIDYRTAYLIVGRTVQAASAQGKRGVDITAKMLDEAAYEVHGRPLELTDEDIAPVLDPGLIVSTRAARGGAAPQAVEEMIASCRARAAALRVAAEAAEADFDAAETSLRGLAAGAATGSVHATQEGD